MNLALVTEQPAMEAVEFEDFWLMYPRRIAKKDAREAWAKMSSRDRIAALTALVDWRRVWIARGEMDFVPYPASWLRGERWEDELPSDCTPMHASQVAAKLPDDSPRGAMPDSVRAVLAKLRK